MAEKFFRIVGYFININKLFHINRKFKSIFYVKWNYFKLITRNIKTGKNIRIYNKFYLNVNKYGKVNIGNNFLFTSGDNYNPLSRNIRGTLYVEKNGKLNIGNNVSISSSCIWASKSITIGDNVKIGADCIIMDTDAHSLNAIVRRNSRKDIQNKNSKEITIGNDVLIGTRCIILKGSHIGDRSIIGSGSIVTKNIPEDCIAAGNPCKIIKYIN